jgi:hypothetical protein
MPLLMTLQRINIIQVNRQQDRKNIGLQ